MRDGIIKDNGTSRAVKASFPETYEEFRAMAQNGTLLLDLLINAEGWSQLPTFLNKANLLDDRAEQQLWGNAANRTMTDAFIKLYRELMLPRLVTAYTTAGSYRWTVQKTGDYVAVIIGGGGSGGAAYNAGSKATGGAAGYVSFWRGHLVAGDTVPVVVGAGGVGVTPEAIIKGGVDGGTSAFHGTEAAGGEGGDAGEANQMAVGAFGGQCSTHGQFNGIIPMGGVEAEYYSSSDGERYRFGTPIPDIFVGADGLPISCLCAGGNSEQQTPRSLPNGNTMSAGVNGTGANLTAATPTDCGAGGGAVVLLSRSFKATSGRGADGGVFIYRLIGGTV